MATTSSRRAEAEARASGKPQTELSPPTHYSADCMYAIGWLGSKLEMMLMRKAFSLAQSDSRTLVTEDDVFAALDQLGFSNINSEGDADDDAEGE